MSSVIERLKKLSAEAEGRVTPGFTGSADTRMKGREAVHRALKLRRQGNYRQALECMRAAEDAGIPMDFTDALNEMGLARFAMGERRRSLQDFDRALAAARRKVGGILVNKTNVLKSLGRHEEALASSDQAIENDPAGWQPYLAAVTVHADRGADEDSASISEILEAMDRRCGPWRDDPVVREFIAGDADLRSLRERNPDLFNRIANAERRSSTEENPT